jgi:nucleotide-binding universal stress UspA family protein
MTYSTLMVHLDIGSSNAGRLQVAGDLADRFGASVVGIAGAQPMQVVYSDGYVSGEMIEDDVKAKEKEIAAAEAAFRGAFQKRTNALEWRSAVTLDPLSDFIACEARSADFVITGVDHNKSVFDASRHVELGDLVMRIGRPVLVVPEAVTKGGFDRILVGWKDTRETRRAVADALPLLKKATFVMVVEIAPESEMIQARRHLDQVVEWLKRHGVAAQSFVAASLGKDSKHLAEIGREQKTDLMVAGAYGHNRVREWMLGGVTHDLLTRPEACAFVSH